MEEKFEDPGLDDTTKRKFKDGVAELELEKDLKIKWKKEIVENESIQKYFEEFSPSSVDGFIDSYLSTKYLAYKYKSFYGAQLEKIRTRWIDEASEHLEAILQKKLFDVQCLWRAEQITLKEVEIAFDFNVWKDNIFNCPFIEITSEDISIYQDFLNSGQAEIDCCDFYEWQEYDDFKSDDEDFTVSMPDWYDFHNLRTGNGCLLLLPNIRGEKEKFYINLFHDNKQKNEGEQNHHYNPKPYLSSHDDDTLKFFVTTFEDAEHRKNILNYKEYNNRTSDENNIDEIIMYMSEIDDIIPIESHHDYRKAIVLAYTKYCLGKVAEHLPLAFEQYLFNKNMKLDTATEKQHRGSLEIKMLYYNKILDGRELNGEPRDLNF